MINNTTILAALNRGDVKAAREYLKANIREEAARKSGAKSADITIMKRLAKSHEKVRKSDLKAQEIHYEGCTYFSLTDGYKLFISDNNYGYKIMEGKGLDLEGIIPADWKERYTRRTLDREAAAIRKAENKAAKQASEKLPVIYQFDDGAVPLGINPEYLLDAMDFTGTTEVYINPDPRKKWREGYYKCVINPVFLYNPSAHRFALVMPMNIEKYLDKAA